MRHFKVTGIDHRTGKQFTHIVRDLRKSDVENEYAMKREYGSVVVERTKAPMSSTHSAYNRFKSDCRDMTAAAKDLLLHPACTYVFDDFADCEVVEFTNELTF